MIFIPACVLIINFLFWKIPNNDLFYLRQQIRILYHPGNIKKGYSPLLHCHTAMTACTITKIIERTDDRTGLTAEDFPTSLSTGNVGLVEMILLKPICIETFFDYPSLGRIILRDLKQTIAVGVVVKVTKGNIKDMKNLLKKQSQDNNIDEEVEKNEIDTAEEYDSLKHFPNNRRNEDQIDGNNENENCNKEQTVTKEGIMERVADITEEDLSSDLKKTRDLEKKDSIIEKLTPVDKTENNVVDIENDNCENGEENSERILKLNINLAGSMNENEDLSMEEDV